MINENAKDVAIGYWGWVTKPDSGYPYPVENSVTDPEKQNRIISLLEYNFKHGYIVRFRGWSNCRLCGKQNGTGELQVIINGTKYVIPQGYLHYLKDHNVAGDDRILDILRMPE